MQPPPNRPTTPLRSTSRTSFRASHTPTTTAAAVTTPSQTTSALHSQHQHPSLHSPLLTLEPAFAELADSMADLEANMQLLQLQHESVARFTDNFAAFLYALDMNAYCVDWTEAPGKESWERVRRRAEYDRNNSDGNEETLLQQQHLQTPKGYKGGGGASAADASMLSTTSTRTATSSSTNTSRLRTPARKTTGIARGPGMAGRGSSRPGSAAAAVSGARGGPSARGGAATRAGRVGRAGAGRGVGPSAGSASARGALAGGRGGRGDGVVRGRSGV